MNTTASIASRELSSDHPALPEETSAGESVEGNTRSAIADLFTPRRSIYWVDLVSSAMLGWASFLVSLQFPFGGPAHLVASVVCILALFRAVCFTHELVHLRKDAVPGLRTGWRLLCGIPLLIPHFLYRGVHISHHSKRDYGTRRDGEYFPFATRPTLAIVAHLAWNLVVPLTAIARFTLLSWIGLVSRSARESIMRKASSMTLRMTFTRELPARKEDLMEWRLEETACTLFATAVLVAFFSGWLPGVVLIQWYVSMSAIATLNAIRAIGATHRYGTNEVEVDFQTQVTDSVNVESESILTLLMCPVGLRYHALHHYFPTLPYHNLGAAHRRLRKLLPSTNSYHKCSIRGVIHGLTELWSEAGGTGAANSPDVRTSRPE